MTTQRFEIREDDTGHFIGVLTLEEAPNDFLRHLMELALEDGEWATEEDEEGCKVTALLID